MTAALPLEDRKVIVAGRKASYRSTMHGMMISLGASEVSGASDCAEVVRQVKAAAVDVILCDYQLDDHRNGQQLLEELRHDKMIPPATIFMMVTAEKSYKKVIAAAEFSPDAYLVKPFTLNQLLERLTRATRRKGVLSRAYALVAAGRADDAIDECGQVMHSNPDYLVDAQRLACDLMMHLQRYADAESLLNQITARTAAPWALMGLASIRFAQHRFEAADALLSDLVARHPEYMNARDFLATVKDASGRPAEALALMENSGAISMASVDRLRRTGDLAAATGNFEKCARMYARAIDRARGSSMVLAQDYLVLSRAYVEQGRLEAAEQVAADQRRSMRGSAAQHVVNHLMRHQRLRNTASGDELYGAAAALDDAVNAHAEVEATMAPAIVIDLLEVCLQEERAEDVAKIAGTLRARGDVEPHVIARLDRICADSRALKTHTRSIVSLDQVIAMLGRLGSQGWNETLGHACRQSVIHWADAAPHAPLLPVAQTRLAEVMRKYGIDSGAQVPVVA